MTTVQLQQAREFRLSKAGVSTRAKEVTHSGMIDLDKTMTDYTTWLTASIEGIKDISVEQKANYAIVLQDIDIPKAIAVSITELMVSRTKTLEFRALGYKLGQKLTKKQYVVDSGATISTTSRLKLGIGCSVLSFLNAIKLIHISTNTRVVAGAPHILKLCMLARAYEEAITPVLGQQAMNVRATGASYTCKEHTSHSAGGTHMNSKTMLNSKGFNPISTQNNKVCAALNKLQNVPYRLVDDVTLEAILKEYVSHARWFTTATTYKPQEFMLGEWNKLLEEIDTFKGKAIHFPHAFDDRGRMYDAGNYLKIQGDSFQKRMLTIDGEPIVWVDAKASGLQMYSLLCADDIGGQYSGLSDTKDAYTGLQLELEKRWKNSCSPIKLDRGAVKRAFIVALYGATGKSLVDTAISYEDSMYFGRSLNELGFEADDVKQAIINLTPRTMQAMAQIYSLVDSDRAIYKWEMPDGFKVNISLTVTNTIDAKYITAHTKELAKVSINVTELGIPDINRGLAAHVIHSVEAYVQREVIRRADFHIASIHDCIGVTEGNVTTVQNIYKQVIIDCVLHTTLLADILKQLGADFTDTLPRGNLKAADIMANTPLQRD